MFNQPGGGGGDPEGLGFFRVLNGTWTIPAKYQANSVVIDCSFTPRALLANPIWPQGDGPGALVWSADSFIKTAGVMVLYGNNYAPYFGISVTVSGNRLTIQLPAISASAYSYTIYYQIIGTAQ